jgi:hypothetical protein
MKRIVVAASLLILGGGLTACGGSSSAPTDASEEDFCAAFMSISTSVAADGTDEEKLDAVKKAADKMAETGTPEGIPADAREGFELLIDNLNDLDVDDVSAGADPTTDDIDEDEMAKVTAFSTYVQETCIPALPELEGEEGTG